MGFTHRGFCFGIVPVVFFYIFELTKDVQSVERNTAGESIGELRYLLGPNYIYIVAAYRRYLFATSCQTLGHRLHTDAREGQLQRFCQFYPDCPETWRQHSCKARAVARIIRTTCCQISDANETAPEIEEVASKTECAGSSDTFNPECPCESQRIFPSPRIIGGSPARRGEFPWVAMLVRDGTFICGVVIMDTSYGITAAHCFDYHMPGDIYFVFAGKHVTDLRVKERGMQRVQVADFVIHEEYDLRLLWNDIAILKFSEPLRWSNNVRPACLPTQSDIIPSHCTVAGWGDSDPRPTETRLSRVLMTAILRAYSPEACLKTFRNTSKEPLEEYLREGIFCAANGMNGGKDACQADSGGPLMCLQNTAKSYAYFVFGIVSSGNGCAVPGEPGLYTNVISYRQWIHDTVDSMS